MQVLLRWGHAAAAARRGCHGLHLHVDVYRPRLALGATDAGAAATAAAAPVAAGEHDKCTRTLKIKLSTCVLTAALRCRPARV